MQCLITLRLYIKALILDRICATPANSISRIWANAFGELERRLDGRGKLIVMIFFVDLVIAPFNLAQLLFALAGAVSFFALQAARGLLRQPSKPKGKLTQLRGKRNSNAPVLGRSHGKPIRKRLDDTAPPQRRERCCITALPFGAPALLTEGFDHQVEELASRMVPSAESERLVTRIASHIKVTISSVIPEAEVAGFISGDVSPGAAFAVAIPEVQVVVSASPHAYAEHRWTHIGNLDAGKLQKSMLKACMLKLIAKPEFKFRRSAFKDEEPRVICVVEIDDQSIPFEFSVNTVTPFFNAALLTDCGQVEPRARKLILLVRRWAKDRGISHASTGNLSPHAWSLMTIYFLQVQGLLPVLEAMQLAPEFVETYQLDQPRVASTWHLSRAPSSISLASLFKSFVRFYCRSFNCYNEAVSVRVGRRQPLARGTPLHVVTLEDGSTDVAPSIEDPLERVQNLSSSMTGAALQRFREEFQRAHDLMLQNASLSEIIEPWLPPNVSAAVQTAALQDTKEKAVQHGLMQAPPDRNLAHYTALSG